MNEPKINPATGDFNHPRLFPNGPIIGFRKSTICETGGFYIIQGSVIIFINYDQIGIDWRKIIASLERCAWLDEYENLLIFKADNNEKSLKEIGMSKEEYEIYYKNSCKDIATEWKLWEKQI